MYQLLNGLKNIHEKNIAHRDLKPENVLLSKDGVIKICDFGSSKIIDPNGKNTPYIVSRYYRAPELILCLTKYSTAIDIWAAGCIMAELFLLTPIFK
jgi:glycogen synthase kinase 3 beta